MSPADSHPRADLRTTFLFRLIVIAGWSLMAAAPLSAQTQGLNRSMQIYRSGSSTAERPPEPSFTGDVRIDGYFQRVAPSRLAGAIVNFEPGSRTPWKVNPMGQTLIVTSGTGWAQCGSDEIVEIRAGDMVWCPPGMKHWEGATPDRAMTYVAIHEGTVQFGDKVTDKEYQRSASSPPPTLLE